MDFCGRKCFCHQESESVLRPAPCKPARAPHDRCRVVSAGRSSMMHQITDWRGAVVDVALSSGGVRAVSNPWDNVIRTGVHPWPPPELLQKVYQSRQVRAFSGDERRSAIAALG